MRYNKILEEAKRKGCRTCTICGKTKSFIFSHIDAQGKGIYRDADGKRWAASYCNACNVVKMRERFHIKGYAKPKNKLVITGTKDPGVIKLIRGHIYENSSIER